MALSDMSDGLRVAGFIIGLVLVGIGVGMIFSHDIITKIEGVIASPLLIGGGVTLMGYSIRGPKGD